MSTPSVSVVIPLYNKERHIARAIQSVLGQTYGDLELVIANDGSTDGGAKAVESISDPRIRLVHQENAGVSAARNRGIAEARADLIAFLDADDEWLPKHLETILRLTRKYPECGAYANAYIEHGADGTQRPRLFESVSRPPSDGVIRNYFRPPSGTTLVWTSVAAVWKTTFNRVGTFLVGLQNGEDGDMWCRIALEFPVAFSNYVGGVYHMNADNRLSTLDIFADTANRIRITTEALRHNRYHKGIAREDISEFRNMLLLNDAARCLKNRQRAKARTCLSLTRSTRLHRHRRLLLCAAALLPYRLITAGWRAIAHLRTR